jgi:hypothetical protein
MGAAPCAAIADPPTPGKSALSAVLEAYNVQQKKN